MKIMQFTDVHIGGASEDTHGVDVKSNLEKVLEAAVAIKPDKLILTGDLCFKAPREDVYAYIKSRLDAHGLDPLIISGNHDDTSMLAEAFDLETQNDEIYFAERWENRDVVFLDTTKGYVSEEQCVWFRNILGTAHGLIVFMHHPPAICGVPYMDHNHAFQQIDEFQDLIKTTGEEVHVFCGHYHVEKSVTIDQLHVHVTPSCFFQIRDDIQEFGVDHYRIGYRVIDLSQEALVHQVVYL